MTLVISSQAISLEQLGLTSFTDLLGSAKSAFIQNNEGLIGFGEALRLTAKGPNRIQKLNSLWKEQVKKAQITDSLNLPNSGLIAFGSISFASQSETESVLVVPQLVIGKYKDQLFATCVNINLDKALKLIQPQTEQNKLLFSEGSITANQFEQNVNKALQLITKDKLSKIVLARDLVAKAKNFNPNPGLTKLAKKYPTCYTYLVDGMFGASPELLVSVANKKVSARVLAGTAGRGTDVEVDKAIGKALSHSHKNLLEHKFAIDSLTSAMAELCIEIKANDLPFSIELPNLWHLASDVKAILKSDSTSLDLLGVLHPSAAVAGTPKNQALRSISAIEEIDRGRYAGPIGWVSANGDGVWAIALRGAQYREGMVRAFAGCGIVAESDAESELAETNLKFKTVLENF